MKEKAKVASVRRRDRLSNTMEAEGLACRCTRKSPNDKKLTMTNIAIVRRWTFNSSSLVDPSPNSRDQIDVKDPITGVKTKALHHLTYLQTVYYAQESHSV